MPKQWDYVVNLAYERPDHEPTHLTAIIRAADDETAFNKLVELCRGNDEFLWREGLRNSDVYVESVLRKEPGGSCICLPISYHRDYGVDSSIHSLASYGNRRTEEIEAHEKWVDGPIVSTGDVEAPEAPDEPDPPAEDKGSSGMWEVLASFYLKLPCEEREAFMAAVANAPDDDPQGPAMTHWQHLLKD